MGRAAILTLLSGVLAIGAFLAYDWTTTSLDISNVSEALSVDESAVQLGWSIDPAALYVVCGGGAPRRLLASWKMPARELDYKAASTARLAAFRSQPFDNRFIEFPASNLLKGKRRELIQTQPLTAEVVQAVSDLFDTTSDYQNAFHMGEEAFYFSPNATAKLGLSAACQGVQQNGIEGRAHG
ncbi:hypothetical protein [Devosia sp. SL43]|uniref:hypothetical protein n=1 Tax=Devosia sp. SL43 TaxID=2806348 RepID=UPI001F4872C6|nr:hypothetical protein [Devosia sp. SL43]UJW87561.1 hypothetical protein IM737_10180 [Devosia sp. SL43]